MFGVILAGGLGSRLWPLYYFVPLHLVFHVRASITIVFPETGNDTVGTISFLSFMSVNTNIDKNTLNTINVILFFLNKIIIKLPYFFYNCMQFFIIYVLDISFLICFSFFISLSKSSLSQKQNVYIESFFSLANSILHGLLCF